MVGSGTGCGSSGRPRSDIGILGRRGLCDFGLDWLDCERNVCIDVIVFEDDRATTLGLQMRLMFMIASLRILQVVWK
jgi:hypothetical protein